MKFNCIEKCLRALFQHHGKFVGKHPTAFTIVPILLTAGFATGIFTLFTSEKDPEVLYGPQGSQSDLNRDILEDLYSSVLDEDMLPRHQLRIGRWGWLIITSKSSESILSTTNVDEVLRLHNNVINISFEQDGFYYKFDDLCLKWNGECFDDHVLPLVTSKTILGNTSLTYPIATTSTGETLLLAGSLGGVTVDEKGAIQKAQALHLTYYLRSDTAEEDEKGLIWEREFLKVMEQFSSDKLNIYRIAYESFLEELELSSGITPDLVVISGFMIGSFSVLATLMLDWVRTKPVLATLGIFTAGLALASTFGLLAFAGIPYANTAGSMPFLILGKLWGFKTSFNTFSFKSLYFTEWRTHFLELFFC